MNMSLEQVKDRLASWYGGAEACLDVKACAELGDMIAAIDAHLTQPAQAVDERGMAFVDGLGWVVQCSRAMEYTRALSAEKVGWVGDGPPTAEDWAAAKEEMNTSRAHPDTLRLDALEQA